MEIQTVIECRLYQKGSSGTPSLMRVATDAHVLIAVFIVNYLDRANVGFAALTMNKDLGFSP